MDITSLMGVTSPSEGIATAGALSAGHQLISSVKEMADVGFDFVDNITGAKEDDGIGSKELFEAAYIIEPIGSMLGLL